MARRYTRMAPVGEYAPFHLVTASSPTGIGCCISTTAPAPGGTGQQTVTPANLGPIFVGQRLNVNDGSTTFEIITVLSVNSIAGTFTANFTKSYTGTINIVSIDGTSLGPLMINAPGSGVTITLRNGPPNLFPVPTDPKFGIFAVITPGSGDRLYQCALDYGLFYQTTQTSFGDYTLHYLDMSV